MNKIQLELWREKILEQARELNYALQLEELPDELIDTLRGAKDKLEELDHEMWITQMDNDK